MTDKKEKKIFWCGFFLILGSLVLFLVIFSSVIKSEWNYLVLPKNKLVKIILDEKSSENNKENKDDNEIIPQNKEFGIIIPQIEVNAKVLANVDPQKESEYVERLKHGVAHTKGSGFPDDDRTVFIFAHSSNNFYQNNKFNTVFYLLRKLKTDDVFYLVYKNKIYSYVMIEKRIVAENEVDYLKNNEKYDVILMTCWPPGTAYKRMLIMGKKIQ